MQDISIFDIVIVSITVLLGLKGIFRGFIKEVFGLIGIVGGIFVAFRTASDVGNIIAPVLALENESAINLIGFIASLIGFWIVMYLIGLILSKVSSMSGLGIFDRIFGFIFGAGKVFLILSIIVAILSHIEVFKDKLETNFANTYSYPLLLKTGGYIIKLDVLQATKKIEKSVDEAVTATKKAAAGMTKEAVAKKVEEMTAEVTQKVEETMSTAVEQSQTKVEETEEVVTKEIKEANDEIK